MQKKNNFSNFQVFTNLHINCFILYEDVCFEFTVNKYQSAIKCRPQTKVIFFLTTFSFLYILMRNCSHQEVNIINFTLYIPSSSAVVDTYWGRDRGDITEEKIRNDDVDQRSPAQPGCCSLVAPLSVQQVRRVPDRRARRE